MHLPIAGLDITKEEKLDKAAIPPEFGHVDRHEPARRLNPLDPLHRRAAYRRRVRLRLRGLHGAEV